MWLFWCSCQWLWIFWWKLWIFDEEYEDYGCYDDDYDDDDYKKVNDDYDDEDDEYYDFMINCVIKSLWIILNV